MKKECNKLNKKIIFGIISMLFCTMLLTGCQQEQTKTFTQTKNGITLQMEYTYKGDTVLQQKATNTMPYAIFPVENKEDIHFLLDRLSEPYQGIKGVEQSIDYQEEQAVETVMIDYGELDFDLAKGIDSIFTDGADSEKKVSMQAVEKWLLEKGFEEIK